MFPGVFSWAVIWMSLLKCMHILRAIIRKNPDIICNDDTLFQVSKWVQSVKCKKKIAYKSSIVLSKSTLNSLLIIETIKCEIYFFRTQPCRKTNHIYNKKKRLFQNSFLKTIHSLKAVWQGTININCTINKMFQVPKWIENTENFIPTYKIF